IGEKRLLAVLFNDCIVRFENTANGDVTVHSETQKFPSTGALALKRGTGGRSSFNGTVCTVFGASGFLGRHVCNKLGKIGTQIIIPFRGDPYEVRHLKVVGDLGQVLFFPYYLRNPESIYKAVKYSNVVINLIGKDNETPSFTYDEVHVEGARLLAKVCRDAGVQRFIHVSSLNCSENPPSHILKGGSRFLKSKYYGELAVREEFPDAIIFRPADIFGGIDRFFRYWQHWSRRVYGRIHLWNKGKGVYKQPVYAGDVAQGIVNAIFDNDAPGKTYDCVGPRRYELYELVSFFNRILEKDERYGWKIKDLRFSPYMWARFAFWGYFFKYPDNGLCWDKVEREMVTDTVTPNHPTLEDLGVQLTLMEPHAFYTLTPLRRMGYYPIILDEYPKINPPPFVQ
ncbi:hypothetical protein B4U79_09089, partial [Dinothrombium tinctorium]